MAHSEFPLPDVGEGLTEAEIVSWKVKPGDVVTVNQVLVEIETAKSLVELPSPFAGTVTELLAEEGATVEVGTPIIRVDSAGGTIELQAPANDGDAFGTITDSATVGAQHEEAETAPAAEESSGAVLVGYGSKGGHAATRRRRPEASRHRDVPPPCPPPPRGRSSRSRRSASSRRIWASSSRPCSPRASPARSCATT